MSFLRKFYLEKLPDYSKKYIDTIWRNLKLFDCGSEKWEIIVEIFWYDKELIVSNIRKRMWYQAWHKMTNDFMT